MTIGVIEMHDENTIPENSRSKMMRRMSSVDKFHVCGLKYQISQDEMLPPVTTGCIRIRVCYAGACSPDVKKEREQIRNKGLLDTSLFPGYEFSGIVDEICSTLLENGKTTLKKGDRCIVYPEEDLGFCKGVCEYVIVKNIENIIPIPDGMSMEIASLLPCGGLTAYTSILRAKPYIKATKIEKDTCNILVIGAGGLGLWTLCLASHLIDPESSSSNIKIRVADTNTEQLKEAQSHDERFGLIHWPNNMYEETIFERTKNACPAGFDVIIDFVSSQRTVSRATQCLAKHGALLVGGNSQFVVPISLATLAENEHTLIGVKRGTRQQLCELVELVHDERVKTPNFKTYMLEEAESVYRGLSECRIKGRAVLRVSESDEY